MSTNEVKFRVSGGDLLSYFDQVKRKSNDLTNSLIAGAKLEEAASKNQLKIIEQTLSAMERKAKISSQLAGLVGATNARERVGNIENRDARLDSIYQNTEQRYKNKEITKGEYDARIGRLSTLSNQNSPEAIIGQFKEYFNKQKEQTQLLQLQTKLSREQINTAKDTAMQNVSAIIKGDRSLEDVISKANTPVEKLAANLTKERVEQLNNKNQKDESEGKSANGGGWLSFAKALAFDRSLGLMAGIPNAKNELDFIKPLSSITGVAAGGTAGNLMDAANIKIAGTGLGQTNFGALGTEIGEKAGEFFGSALERSYRGRDELTTSNFRLQALMGRNLNVNAFGADGKLGGTGRSDLTGNLSAYGLDYNATAGLQYDIARRQGNGRNIGRNVENVIAAESGLGLSKESSYGLIDLARSTGENKDNVLKTITSILSIGEKGVLKGDRTFFNEFVGNLTKLSRTFLQTTESIKAGSVAGLINSFDKVGGAFSARDERSVGLISQVNDAFVNPKTDAAKGLRFLALRRAFPKMNSFELQEQAQKGLSDPMNRKAFNGEADMLGGDETYKMWQFASLNGLTGNLAAARRLYNNRNNVDNTSGAADSYSEDDVRNLGKSQTGRYSKSTAEIQNQYVDDLTKAIGLVGVKMTELFGDMVDGLKDYINKTLGIGGTKTPPISSNSFYSGKSGQSKSPSGYNMRDPAGRRAALEAGDYGSKF